jgi:excisionase family DNA binding protein
MSGEVSPQVASERTMDVGEAAEFLGVNPREVYQAIQDGRLPARKAERRIVLATADVEAFQAVH